MNKYIDEELKCDVCGMSYSEFLKTGIFGCPNCYIVFKARTVEIIKKEINVTREKPKQIIKKSISKGERNNIHIKIKELKKLLSIYEENDDFEMIEKIKSEIKKIEELGMEH